MGTSNTYIELATNMEGRPASKAVRAEGDGISINTTAPQNTAECRSKYERNKQKSILRYL